MCQGERTGGGGFAVASRCARRRMLNIRTSPIAISSNPCVLAKEAVSLDHLSGGRFELGLGWGSVPGELERFGLVAEDSRTRAGRLAEGLDVLAALFTGEDVDYDGDFYTLRGARQSPRPLAGRVPVVIGGGGPKLTMPLVARHADWWNCPS